MLISSGLFPAYTGLTALNTQEYAYAHVFVYLYLSNPFMMNVPITFSWGQSWGFSGGYGVGTFARNGSLTWFMGCRDFFIR